MEADLIKNVVDCTWTNLNCESSCDLEGLVGIESRIEQIESRLDIHSQEACITVGIWGMGGIGKTTLAETVFHRLSSKFEASCFLKNVREKSEQPDGLDCLQKKLISEIFKEEGLSIESTVVRNRLSRTKVLIVLDDVSSPMQMECLAGDRLRYGTGSRIIITSRDRGTLRETVEEDNIYEVEVLKPDDALQLFYSHAFKNKTTSRTGYKELAKKVVDYAKGVPLALTVLGSLFFKCMSKEDWEDEFHMMKRFRVKDIQKVLRISYDTLGENEKEIFLDIACFHKGSPVDRVKTMLDARGLFAAIGIRILVEKALISIYSTEWRTEVIEMHDLLQEMGRTIVREQCIGDPSKKANSAEWIFLVTCLFMEMLSAACDQASSPRRPGYALFGMLLAIAALLTCIWELIYKGRKNNKVRRKRGCFGSVNEIFGLLGGIAQCVCSIVQYVYYIRRANNPIKLSLFPAIYLICLIATRLSRKRMQTTYERKRMQTTYIQLRQRLIGKDGLVCL